MADTEELVERLLEAKSAYFADRSVKNRATYRSAAKAAADARSAQRKAEEEAGLRGAGATVVTSNVIEEG